MPFILPMLCTRPRSPGRLSAGGYVAEPKLDGQRVQLHIERGRTVNAYSRSGSDLLRYPGMSFLREMRWPVDAAVLDGEAIAGEGHEGLSAALACRGHPPDAMTGMAFDLLALEGHGIMREPWRERRRQLEELVDAGLPGVRVISTARDGARLWRLWVDEGGGDGIVLKAPDSTYQPGVRSPAWLKVKAKVTLEVIVIGGAPRPIHSGDWGTAQNLKLAYRHPRTGVVAATEQAVRVPRGEVFDLRPGARAEILCWGVMPSGRLRHPLFSGWVPDRAVPATRDQISASRRMIAVTGEQVQQSEALMQRSRTILRDSKQAVEWSARARDPQAGPLAPDP